MSDPKKDPTEIDLDDFLDLDFGKDNQLTNTKKDIASPDTSAGLDVGVDLDFGKPTSPDADNTLKVDNSLKDDSFSLDDVFKLETSESSTTPPSEPTVKKSLMEEYQEMKKDTADLSVSVAMDKVVDDPVTPVAVLTPKKEKKSLFGKKKSPNTSGVNTTINKPKSSKIKPPKTANDTALLANPKKVTMLIIGGILILILIGVLLYSLLGNDSSENAPTPTPVVSEPAPTPPPSESVPSETTNPADTNLTPTDTSAPTDSSATNDVLPSTIPELNPDEILNAEIPQDPALIKEEIDRLTDTDSQLSQQSKMLEDQLATMNELANAKDEEIALLEAQIAELEKQNAK